MRRYLFSGLLFLAAFLFLPLSSLAGQASFSWNMELKGDSYWLTMEMHWPEYVNLNHVIHSLSRYDLLAAVSEPIQSGQRSSLDSANYEQALTLERFFVKSVLHSNCHEERSKASWTRHCDLDVTKGAGKLSMVKKFDKVRCQNNTAVSCRFQIQGTARDLKILGIELMSREKIILKGKYEALKNFSKLWFFLFVDRISLNYALKSYADSELQKHIESVWREGQSKLQKTPFYFVSKGSFTATN